MSQRKPAGEHSGGRRKSESRQKIVAVRFSDAEYEMLTAAMKRTGKPAGRVLRQAFFAYDEQWNEAIDWLLNSRHCGDPDIQEVFWALAEGEISREEANER